MEALKRAFADVDRTFAPPTREEQQREKERSLILRQYEAEEQAYNAGSDATPSPDLLKHKSIRECPFQRAFQYAPWAWVFRVIKVYNVDQSH